MGVYTQYKEQYKIEKLKQNVRVAFPGSKGNAIFVSFSAFQAFVQGVQC